MPYPSQSDLYSRFGPSPCTAALDARCRRERKNCTTCNKCEEPYSKRLCLLTRKMVKTGCQCLRKGRDDDNDEGDEEVWLKLKN